MEKVTTTKPIKNSVLFTRWAYAIFTLVGLYFFIFSADWTNGIVFGGLALVFDPFNPEQKWQDRPLYQRVWLLVHVGVTLGLFIWKLITDFEHAF